MKPIRLTQTVQKGGCAAKLPATELRKILSQISFPPTPPEMMVDGGTFDDAAVIKVTDEIALVQTIDFFTPIVDDPRDFGRIAAANALSDVYAMGGRPKTCLAVLGFSPITISNEVVQTVLQGACSVIEQAGAALVGGHTIDDDAMKFGLSVTGYVHPKEVWTNAGARVGDDLLLTKALGTGTLTAALKRDILSESDIQPAVDSMCSLNNVVDLLTDETRGAIHASTDITGFGLSGHGMQLAAASGVRLEIKVDELPHFDHVRACLEKEILTKAHRTNRDYTDSAVHWAQGDDWQKLLTCDPQTSGGLLLAVDPAFSATILSQLKQIFPYSTRVGVVREAHEGEKIRYV